MEQEQLVVNFGEQQLSPIGKVEWKTRWGAIKRAFLACLVMWFIGVVLTFIPIANWAVNYFFFFLGPVLGFLVFYQSRHMIERMDAQSTCPKCRTKFEIKAHNKAPPIFGECPNCKAGYQLHIPEKEVHTTRVHST